MTNALLSPPAIRFCLLLGALASFGCNSASHPGPRDGGPLATDAMCTSADGGAMATYGNGMCEDAETCASCATDCGACSSHSVALAWNASATAGVTYNVYRGTVAGGPYAGLVSGLTATSATDSAVSAATTYYYVVRAHNAGGESASSNEISAAIP